MAIFINRTVYDSDDIKNIMVVLGIDNQDMIVRYMQDSWGTSARLISPYGKPHELAIIRPKDTEFNPLVTLASAAVKASDEASLVLPGNIVKEVVAALVRGRRARYIVRRSARENLDQSEDTAMGMRIRVHDKPRMSKQAQLATLELKITDVQSDIVVNESSIKELEASLKSRKRKQATLPKKLKALKAKYTALEAQIKKTNNSEIEK